MKTAVPIIQQKRFFFRPRMLSLFLTILIMLWGLLWQRTRSLQPEFFALYAGDALWAMMVFFGVVFLKPSWSGKWAAVAALLFAFAIEFSQFYLASWIETLRNHWLGALILGDTFCWGDLICYTVGVGAGFCLDWFLTANPLIRFMFRRD